MHFCVLIFAVGIFLPYTNARTDLTGCTRTDISSPAGASYAWIVPSTGEVCEFLECGGGRAPPKSNVPGCAAYTGSQVYEPSYLAGFTAAGGMSTIMSTTTASPMAITTTPDSFGASVTPTAGMVDGDEYEGGGEDDGPDAGESASAATTTMTNAAVATAFTTDFIATAVGSSDYQGSTIWSSNETSDPTSTSQASTSSSIIGLISTATTYSTTTSTTFSSFLSSISSSGTITATGSSSMSRSWVKTVPTFTRAAADGEIVRAGVIESASASLVASTGAAGRFGVIGGLGTVAVVMGVLVVM